MRNTILRAAVAGALLTIQLAAQDLTGIWQGTLTRAGRDFRVAIRISKSDGSLSGLLFNVEQGGAPVPSAPIEQQGSSLTINMPGIGVTYKPTLSPDGKTMSGGWTQGPESRTVTLRHVADDEAWPLPEAAAPAPALDAANPKFEVASIRLSRPDAGPPALTVVGRRFLVSNYSLSNMITYAFALHQNQISGGPAWRDSERFDISAEREGRGQPSQTQLRQMLKDLIVDRFRLGYHMERRELPVYLVTALKSGTKLTPVPGAGIPTFGYPAFGTLQVRNATMDDFAKNIQRIFLDRPVIDRTGLTGKYDFALTWKPDDFQFGNYGGQLPPAPPDSDSRSDLFTAFQRQLGLKLEAAKADVDVMTIDKAEKPAAN